MLFKRTSSIILITLLSSLAHAVAVHDFVLQENDKIAGRCDVENQSVRSKFKMYVISKGNSTVTLTIKANICTTQFGFRKLNMDVSVPSLATQHSGLSNFAIGQSQRFQAGGNEVTLTRQNNSGSKMVFQVDGVDPSGKIPSLFISVPTNYSDFDKIRNSNRLQLPWSNIRFQVRQGLAGTFSFDGRLNEIQLE